MHTTPDHSHSNQMFLSFTPRLYKQLKFQVTLGEYDLQQKGHTTHVKQMSLVKIVY